MSKKQPVHILISHVTGITDSSKRQTLTASLMLG